MLTISTGLIQASGEVERLGQARGPDLGTRGVIEVRIS